MRQQRQQRFRDTYPVLVLAAGALLFGLVSSATSGASAASEAAARGAVTYRVYCGRCHGPAGKGDGKLGATLKEKPADLTALAARPGGFDADAVRRAIDGRETRVGHESTDMPTWGLSLQDPARDASQEQEVQARIADLVAYLATLQAPTPH